MKFLTKIWDWFHKYSNAFTESLIEENKSLQLKVSEINEKYQGMKTKIQEVRKQLSDTTMELENMYEKAKYPIYKPEIKRTVSKTVIENSLRMCLKVPQEKIILTDEIYYLTSLDEMTKLIASDPTNKSKYSATFDCDDFSTKLYAVIKIYGGGIVDCSITNRKTRHSINCFIDNNLNVYIIEGETDVITLAQDYRIMGQKINFNDKKDLVRV